MKRRAPQYHDDYDDPLVDSGVEEETAEDDLWFLPGPMEEAPDDLPPGPWAEPPEPAIIDDWRASGYCKPA